MILRFFARFLLLSFFVLGMTPFLFCLPATKTYVYTISTAPFDSKKVEQVMAILKAAYAQIGIDVEFKILPGERALLSANAGETDADLHRIDGINKTYSNLIKVNVPLAYNQHSAFVKDLKIEINGYESLKKYSIAYTRGFKAIERGTAVGFNTSPVKDDDAAFRMLASGRVDVVITDRDDGLKVLDRLGVKEIKPLSPPVEVIALYHYVHSQHADLVPKLEKVLSQVKPVR
jgi:polar amino acid transport system substrate-binding protein